MQLPDFTDDQELNDLRARMGARDLGQFRLSVNAYRFTVSELESLIDGGIGLRYLDEVRALEDGTLAFKDRRVLLHAQHGAPALPPFHLADCDEVQRLRAVGLGAPHVVSAREDGLFRLLVERGNQNGFLFERLLPCESCLDRLAFAGFSAALPAIERERRTAEFMITRFFEKYRRNLAVESPPSEKKGI